MRRGNRLASHPRLRGRRRVGAYPGMPAVPDDGAVIFVGDLPEERRRSAEAEGRERRAAMSRPRKVSIELEPEVVSALGVYRDLTGLDSMKAAAEDLVKEGLYVFSQYMMDLRKQLEDEGKEPGE